MLAGPGCRKSSRKFWRGASVQPARRYFTSVHRRVTGKEELGVEHDVGALAGGIRPRLARLGKVAGNVADRRIELGNGDAQYVGLLGHAC